jgi:hypothetical protein
VTVVGFIVLLLIGSVMSAVLVRIPSIGTRSGEENALVMAPCAEIGLISDQQMLLPTDKSLRQLSSTSKQAQLPMAAEQMSNVATHNPVVVNPLSSINADTTLPPFLYVRT